MLRSTRNKSAVRIRTVTVSDPQYTLLLPGICEFLEIQYLLA